MNDSKTKENKEPMDESNVDWSTFAEDFMKLWSGSKIPPELNSRSCKTHRGLYSL